MVDKPIVNCGMIYTNVYSHSDQYAPVLFWLLRLIVQKHISIVTVLFWKREIFGIGKGNLEVIMRLEVRQCS